MNTSRQSDYRVTIKVRNANLLRAIECIGERPGGIFAKKASISYVFLSRLIACKESPLKKNGDYKDDVVKLCVFLNKMPCELFSYEQLEPLNASQADVELTQDQCAELQGYNRDPQALLSGKEWATDVLDVLMPREREVVCRRLGIDRREETLAEVGDAMGVSSSRVRQIEEKAMRKLRRDNSVRVITDRVEWKWKLKTQ